MSATAVAHRERLARRLLQNWTAMHPTDAGPTPSTPAAAATGPHQPAAGAPALVVDDSLTSLAWLQVGRHFQHRLGYIAPLIGYDTFLSIFM